VRRARRLALAALVVGVAWTGDASAEELSEEARRAADAAFADWRHGRLDTILEGAAGAVDQEPLWVRDLYWRPDALARHRLTQAPTPPDVPPLAKRRRDWLRSGGKDRDGRPLDYPTPDAGEVEPYPRITALVLDRLRRERMGVAGLPDDGPLAREEWAKDLVGLVRVAYRPDAATTRTAADREVEDRRAGATRRNRLLGLAAVVALLGLAAVASLVVGRRTGAASRMG
jgi:hypothetical protein